MGATAIAYGDTLAGTVDNVSEMDSYSFSGTAGDVVKAQMSDGSVSPGSINNWIRIFDPTGVEIANVKGDLLATTDVTLASTGTYLMVLGDGNSANTSGYTISLELVPPPP